ncbi:MAG: hypothetical protein AAF468_11070 [Pseudomonadota bacterium]
MKRLLLSAIFLATSMSATAVQAHEWRYHYSPELTYQVYRVANWDVLNMRSGPGANYQKVGALGPYERGIYIQTCARHARWCLVSAGARQGWVNMKFLRGIDH